MKIKKRIVILFLVLLSIITVLDLFHPGFPITHDGQDHVARIANFYKNLEEGNIIPRWGGNLNWGYGHPVLMFLYPTSSYLSSFFHFLGFSLFDSIKIVFGLTFILSGVTMYLWLREYLGEIPAALGGFLYMFAPYRFVDLYVRGAIGEHVAFMFLPLVFYFLLKLSKKDSSFYLLGGSLSLAFLILSHNAISLMFLPLIIFYATYLIYKSDKKRALIIKASLLIVLGFGVSSFFWLPAFFEGKYTLRNIVTAGGYKSHFVEPLSFIYGQWNYGGSGQFTQQIGIVNLIILIVSFLGLFTIFKLNKNRIIVSVLLIYSLISIFLMLNVSSFIWQKVMIMQNFQFPWRLLSVIVFTTAVLGAFVIKSLSKKYQFIILILSVTITMFLTKDYWHAKGYFQKPDNFFTGIYNGTTDTGESSPIWSVRFMEHGYKTPIEAINGNVKIKEIIRTSTEHKYELQTDSVVRIRENTLYFPGWFVFVDNKPVTTEFQDPQNRGLMTFFVDKGTHNIDVKFKETKIRFIGDIISLFSALILFSYIFIYKIKRRTIK